jgi:membrane-associated phospholipid phosphatase
LLAFTRQGDILLFINSFSNPSLDFPVRVFTELGHGTFAAIVVILLLFFRFRYAAQLAITLGMTALFANVGKRFLFITHNRPLWYLNYADFHRVLDDTPLNYFNSFPSGHSMTGFAVAATLAAIINKRWASIALFTTAILIAFSRIYLCQHFFVDTYWGAILGTTAAFLASLITHQYLVCIRKVNLENGLWSLFIQKRNSK